MAYITVHKEHILNVKYLPDLNILLVHKNNSLVSQYAIKKKMERKVRFVSYPGWFNYEETKCLIIK